MAPQPGSTSGSVVPLTSQARTWAGVASIVALAALSYWPALHGGFLLDDDALLTGNRLVKAADGWYRIWFTTEPVDYWPLTNTSFWLEWRLWAMSSTGYHVTNLLLHVVEACLIWVILQRLSIPGAYLAAVLFAVHPVNVQSVAWIAQRKNLLAMLFFLVAVLTYVTAETGWKHQLRPLGRWYWLSLTAFVLAMLSKGSVAVLPFVLLLITWWRRPLTRVDLLRIAPFLLLSGVLVLVNAWFQNRANDPALHSVGVIERLLGAAAVIWFYLYKALLPIHLFFVYPQWQVHKDQLAWWIPLFAVVIVTTVLLRYRHSWGRPFLFAWGYYCVALIPVLGFTTVVFMIEQSLVADHYQHLALIGVVALVAAGWATWQQRVSTIARRALMTLAIGLVAFLATLTWRQSSLYADATTLFAATLAQTPDSPIAHNNLGFVLLQAGHSEAAREHFEAALRLDPNYAPAHNNLGAALAQTGKFDAAVAHLQAALELRPNYPDSHNNLGATLREAGRAQEAIPHFEAALRLRPDFAEAHSNLANALMQVGREKEANVHLQEAARLKPGLRDVEQR